MSNINVKFLISYVKTELTKVKIDFSCQIFWYYALCGYNLLSSDFWFCILWLHFFVFRFHNVGYFITQNIYKQKEYYHPHPSKKPPISIFVDSTTTLD